MKHGNIVQAFITHKKSGEGGCFRLENYKLITGRNTVVAEHVGNHSVAMIAADNVTLQKLQQRLVKAGLTIVEPK